MRRWLILACAIATEVTATLSLKAALETPAFYAVVVAGYLASFVFLAVVLRAGMPLGVAYGIWGATGVALTAVLSLLLFGEPISGMMGIGIVLVIAGVLLVEFGSHVAPTGGEVT
ncbi:MAG: QacE family quaternary ammonium compound efflux transporter [Naasia sp.]|nr:QacE family quaternary ammonium compound efflux transporter [Naasia sp.]